MNLWYFLFYYRWIKNDLVSSQWIIIGIVLIIIPETAINPYQRGFFCDDLSIRLPYKDDTVTPELLALIICIMTFGTVGLSQKTIFAYFDLPVK